MAALAIQRLGKTGIADVVFEAAGADGDTVPAGVAIGGWHQPVVVLVTNGGASPVNVTVGDLAPTAVAAGKTAAIPVQLGIDLGDPVPVEYSDNTDVTVAVIGF